ncbi:MAG: SIR2 family protein [Gammaproteobacteria bacterium]|nr:SIR2 family protein [Gammaproteobacteria bacterium]
MTQNTIHNPDHYMSDVRQILSQGKKRIGLLIGAGAPVSVKIDQEGKLSSQGNPIIPDVIHLTEVVINALEDSDKQVITTLRSELDDKQNNIEGILTRVRKLSQAIGSAKIHGFNGDEYGELAERICKLIGESVNPALPQESNPYTELVSWVGGINREFPIEIFSPNYDLLLEEAFERALLPYFDGFSGSHRPFFDPASIATDRLPARWSRLWKIHGSLGWDISDNTVIRTGNRNATKLIFPDHLKYDQITRQPYSALFERLKIFLTTPDSLLICTGFSFFDAHITAVLDEALEANTHTSLLAFQYGALAEEQQAVDLAMRRPNMSVYAKDGAVIFGLRGDWKPGEPPSDEWLKIRQTFWDTPSDEGSNSTFLLGDFAKLARFFVLSQASEFTVNRNTDLPKEDCIEPNVDDISSNSNLENEGDNAKS